MVGGKVNVCLEKKGIVPFVERSYPTLSESGVSFGTPVTVGYVFLVSRIFGAQLPRSLKTSETHPDPSVGAVV